MLVLTPDIAQHFNENASLFNEMMQLQGETLRQMDGRTTQRIKIGDQTYFIKQHRGVGFKEILKNWLQLKLPIVNARNEWLALTKLMEHNILAPRVLGYGLRGFNPATQQSFVLLEAIEPSISLETVTAAWKDNKPSFAYKQALINAVADITAKMHNAGINHRDLYICHFLLTQQTSSKNEGIPLYLIDLHRAQIRDTVPMRWRIKDLAGLYFSSLHIGLTKHDRLRFMKRYSKQSLRNTLEKDAIMWNKTYLRGEKLNRDHQ